MLSGLMSVTFATAVLAHGKSTERYIPIGLSPDSGRFTLQGRIEAVDPRTHTLRLRSGASVRAIRATDATSFWLDRSRRRLTNLELTFGQLRTGNIAEVRCMRGVCEGAVTAEWIKVEDDAALESARK
jgi:hypothetical protein